MPLSRSGKKVPQHNATFDKFFFLFIFIIPTPPEEGEGFIRVCNYVGWHLPHKNILSTIYIYSSGMWISDIEYAKAYYRQNYAVAGISYVSMQYFSSLIENACNIMW